MDFKSIYNEKLTSAKEIADRINSGDFVAMDAALSQAQAISFAISDRAKNGELTGIKVQMLLDVYPYEFYKDAELAKNIMGVSWFSGGGARGAVNAAMADIVPCYYRDMPGHIANGYEYDSMCISVSPMDKHGYMSVCATSSYIEAAMSKSKHIYLEVNESAPRCVCGTQIHVTQADAICENNHDLPALPETKLDETSIIIGNLIAEQIKDGSCIQLGIGAIPDAVGLALQGKHDLGIHTEMFTDSMVDLTLCGAVNNSKKQIHRGQSVTTFAYGSKKMYDFIDDNPGLAFMSVDYVNNPEVICLNDNFVSINAALEVDIFGQVCAESVGTKHMSGTGGQVDYVRGACQSKGGQSFIAFSSTAKGGTISKIKNILTPGAIVTTSKNDVDNIVTEYGIAQLRGESLSTRAKNLISIAHPDFRDELTFEAKKRGIII